MNVNDRPGPAMALPSWARVGGTKAGALGWSLRRTPSLQRPPPCHPVRAQLTFLGCSRGSSGWAAGGRSC